MANLCRIMGKSAKHVLIRLAVAIIAATALAGVARAEVSPEIRAHAERKCLAEALYFEAAAEGEPGMRAVAEVIFRRMRSPGYPGTVCKVVYQGEFDDVCQFSFACDGARRRPRGRVLWRQAWNLAGQYMADISGVLARDTTQGATHFHTVDVNPGWDALGLEKTVTIGRHIFWRPKREASPQ